MKILLACEAPPSIEYVYGAVPLDGLMVADPLLATEQVACVSAVVEVMDDPVKMVIFLMPVQPMASLILIVWAPGVKPVKVLLAWKAPPSIE